MDEYLSLLQQLPLFYNIERGGIQSLLQCLSAFVKTYNKNDFVYAEGEEPKTIGIILEGEVQIIKEDADGNRMILTEAVKGDLFAESFACAKVKEIPVSVITTTKSKVLHMDFQRIIKTCKGACDYHSDLVSNMIGILASKNVMLNQKIEYLSKRSTREKLMSYLMDESKRAGSRTFEIPFKRQELADFLCVDRSAMTSELSRMQADGLIHFQRNNFILAKKSQ